MPTTCVSPNCNSGYCREKRDGKQEKIDFHKLRPEWIPLVPCKKRTHTSNSKICSRHFHEDDFLLEHKTGNVTNRSKNGGKMMSK